MIITPTIRAHIYWKLREADFYLHLLEQQSSNTFNSARQYGFTWTNPQHQRQAQELLFLFSAFLSAFRCVTFYIEKACKKRAPPSPWYEDQKKSAGERKSLLAAFSFLRDSDVHDRTLSTSPGVRHTFNFVDKSGTSEFMLNANDLRTIEMLQDRPWAVEALTNDSVLSISEKVLGELRTVVEEGIREGLF